MRLQRVIGGWVIGCFFIATCVSGVLLVSAADTPKAGAIPPYELDLIAIQNKGYKQDREGPVKFTHQKHARDYKISCWDCHHEYKDGQNTWSPWGEIKRCSQCHDPSKDRDKVMNLQKAFHVNCKSCHKSLYEKKTKTGPHKKCADCHEKTP